MKPCDKVSIINEQFPGPCVRRCVPRPAASLLVKILVVFHEEVVASTIVHNSNVIIQSHLCERLITFYQGYIFWPARKIFFPLFCNFFCGHLGFIELFQRLLYYFFLLGLFGRKKVP